MAASLRIVSLLLCLWGASAAAATAQTEREQARVSLQGVDGFYLSLNTVGDASVQDSLDFGQLHRNLRARLQQAGLPVWPEDQTPAPDRLPYLHVHVNTVHAGRGLYPFGVEIQFYQAVRLVRAPAAPTVAVTWSTSVVGVASYDQLGIIPDAALTLLEEFVEDFQRVNL